MTKLEVLNKVEKAVKQREAFEKISPSLKSSLEANKIIVEAGINAIIFLVSGENVASYVLC